MKLITPELEQRFAEIGDQSEIENPLFITKFFNPSDYEEWYVCSYDITNDTCYGWLVDRYSSFWGRFTIEELESMYLPFEQQIKRDVYFNEMSFKELKAIKRAEELHILELRSRDQDNSIER